MPTYEYQCKSCGTHHEVVQKFGDDPLTECPSCGGPLRKVFGAVGVVFKGSGFYKNDSRTSAKKSERSDKPDKSDKSEKSDKSDKSDTKTAASDKSGVGSSDGSGSKSSDSSSGTGPAPKSGASTSTGSAAAAS